MTAMTMWRTTATQLALIVQQVAMLRLIMIRTTTMARVTAKAALAMGALLYLESA